jgi:hypothetical protein
MEAPQAKENWRRESVPSSFRYFTSFRHGRLQRGTQMSEAVQEKRTTDERYGDFSSLMNVICVYTLVAQVILSSPLVISYEFHHGHVRISEPRLPEFLKFSVSSSS